MIDASSRTGPPGEQDPRALAAAVPAHGAQRHTTTGPSVERCRCHPHMILCPDAEPVHAEQGDPAGDGPPAEPPERLDPRKLAARLYGRVDLAEEPDDSPRVLAARLRGEPTGRGAGPDDPRTLAARVPRY